ncbi:MAG: DUF4926 domain-containing protein [Alphaproteobacteria bacterium]|nr:DUF4926 domain-containing protein [Alphaproteobacteria bacterium]
MKQRLPDRKGSLFGRTVPRRATLCLGIVNAYHASILEEGPVSGDRNERHPELSRVSLARPLTVEHGVLPAGSTGTVVHVYPGEVAYEIEFVRPFHALVTVESAAIRE